MSTLSTRQAEQNLAFPLDYYLYHEAVGVVIIAVPKVGCSTVKRWFMRNAGADPRLDPHKHAYEHLALARRSPAEASSILESRRVLMPVRDPAERLRSAFVDKFIWPKTEDLFEPARDIIEDLHRARGVEIVHNAVHAATFGGELVPVPACSAVDYTLRPSFRTFAEYICAAENEHLDAHWRAQSCFIVGHRIDAFVPLDALSDTLSRISETLGVQIPTPEAENVTRKEPASRGLLADVPAIELHQQDLFPLLDELADQALQQRIRSRFRDDVLLVQHATGEQTST